MRILLQIMLITAVVLMAGCQSEKAPTAKPTNNQFNGEASASKKIKPVTSMITIPAGWVPVVKNEDSSITNGDNSGIIQGDLNQDGLNDQAVVLQQNDVPADGSTPNRMLLIAFAQKDGSLKEVVRSDKAILRSDEGGVMGDPFDNMEIRNGSLYLHFWGGSREKWDQEFQFRYQDHGFFLIGATLTVTEPDAKFERLVVTTADINFVTKQRIIRQSDDEGKSFSTLKTEAIRGEKWIEMRDFNPRNQVAPDGLDIQP